jgi:DNA-binding helix-hairpin-helix protein with protein kinase domain
MSVLTNLFFADGKPCSLGRKLGTGGEGAVFELHPLGQNFVAKVYHRPIKPDKQKKLVCMARECDEALKQVAAWPVASLHYGRGGPVCGFLMPKISGFEAIHYLYGPTHRKQVFPKADWAFLVNAARNLAAAFEVIHVHGHVVADVNQGNVVVAVNSVIKLIDCDSFQISVAGNRYFCEVGVAHFTPPELQSVKSFRSAERTQNHDNFGLALLCFHLLFMGRHPFSGVYSGKEDMPIERAIREFRFAFGKNGYLKGMKPPPNSVGLDVVSPGVALLFQRAFSEAGAQPSGRPNAGDWLRALEQLKSEIRTCQVESVHKYYGGLNGCPWCALERKSGVLFFISVISVTPAGGVFNLSQVWQRILAVASPGEAPSISPDSFSPSPNPLPQKLRNAKIWGAVRKLAAVGIVIWCLSSFPSAFIFVIILALIIFFWRVDDSGEKRARQDAGRIAETKWDEAQRRWKLEAGDAAFRENLQEATKMKNKYENLNNEYSREKQKLQAAVRERQLLKFLDTFFIHDHSIPKIGAGRKATLASFGVETAADIEPGKILSINGFGAGLTNELSEWRKGLEKKFRFDPSKGVDPADIAALNQKFRLERTQIEGALLATPELLNKVRGQILLKREALRSQIDDVAKGLAQARADLSVFG